MSTTQQPEALRLAELIRLSGALPGSVSDAAASELRRQRARIAELESQLAVNDARTPGSVAAAAPVVSDAQIKAVFLANGFTIKEGLTDLKPYVYQAARALLATGGQAQAVERWMGIGKAIERACADLPEETEIIVSLEKDAGTVTLIDQNGNEHENFSCDYGFAGVLNEAIDAALAAQTKHGEAKQ